MTLIEIMAEVGIAIELNSDPYRVLRLRKNQINQGSSVRRAVELLIKQDVEYLKAAAFKVVDI